MDKQKGLSKCTSSPIESNADDFTASGLSSDESAAQNSPEDVDLAASSSRSQLYGERRQQIQQAYVELGNLDVVCGRGFQPDSKNGAGFDKECTPNDPHCNFLPYYLRMSQAFLVTLGCIG
jgi:hypothetical protein